MAVTSTPDHARHLAVLRSALELLAAEPAQQLAELERLGTLPSLDELSLEFDDVRGLVPELVRHGVAPAELEEVMSEIDAGMGRMPADSELWNSAEIGRPQWRSLRALSRRALELLPDP